MLGHENCSPSVLSPLENALSHRHLDPPDTKAMTPSIRQGWIFFSQILPYFQLKSAKHHLDKTCLCQLFKWGGTSLIEKNVSRHSSNSLLSSFFLPSFLLGHKSASSVDDARFKSASTYQSFVFVPSHIGEWKRVENDRPISITHNSSAHLLSISLPMISETKTALA